jgi:hypothetical protein
VPLAMSRPYLVRAAKIGSWCTGLSSPTTRANSATDVGVSTTLEENRSCDRTFTARLSLGWVEIVP